MSMDSLFIQKKIWEELILELKKRGRGRRESGAFLIGNNMNVETFICYDDLDPKALRKGMIIFHSEGFIPLFSFCQKNKMKVLADVHTHPGVWTLQSELDRKHPMIAVAGHLSLIVPNYAKGNVASIEGVGIHEYISNYSWKYWSCESEKVKLS